MGFVYFTASDVTTQSGREMCIHTERVDALRRASTRQIKLMLKIVSVHTEQVA